MAVTAPRCDAASYHKASPPNLLVLGYPSGNVVVNHTLNAGFDGGGAEVAGDYYGFAWNTSISLVLPNGTHLGGISASNAAEGSSTCSGSASRFGPNSNASKPNAFGALYNQTSVIGTYTLLWNVTYGTSTDTTVANQTSCDLSRLSYETFVFNRSINIVASTSSSNGLVGYTKEERTFTPTGFIMSNGAGFTKRSASLVFLGVLCVFLQIL
ncbi:hypothetical protein PHLGIDRAFT_31615 [Phlebiopsis gigantea 11061_1 CR5-6]|uniref:Uncharacterized protein n=1 Tax=Phlebiopsis gigantea (strain 11061_1 CR5-6) TaxID=745531 RepID=A0A0C3S2K4_PHLG1|nr:hypothetical protein PHLGIDRAFT_31615 [Phlebiopsis gigantea 11061_1 CR5-6]